MSRAFRHIAILLTVLFHLQTLTAQRHQPLIPESFTMEEYPAIAERVLIYMENHGYPFASVSLHIDSLTKKPVIRLDTGMFITFDSIVIKGDAKISTSYLYPYLGIKRGSPYNETTVQEIDKRLASLPFVSIARPSGVAFFKNKAVVYLYLNRQSVNQFDGYIGITPQDEHSGKVAVNGELELSLTNLFKIGEHLDLHWRSSERYSQYLDISAQFNYLFKTHFGIEGNFNLDKHDTSYLLLHYHIGIPYSFHHRNTLTPYFDFRSSTVMNPALLDFSSDSVCIDYRKRMYGLRLYIRETDAPFIARRGFEIEADLSAGRRIIRKNAHVDDALYDGLPMQKTDYRLYGLARGYIPIWKYFSIVTTGQFGTLVTGRHYYNELLTIGGERGIRGFNPNDLAASTFLLYSLEFRYHFMKNSFVNLFFDGGIYEQSLHGFYSKDYPLGFGVGINMSVRAGLFYLNYALGRQQGNPISFRTGKIHFGIKVGF
ncbi:MAG: hypothetical protein J6T59_01385 [Bacteroidales bacterium]|nr:hypothetical protein [Bacteroidales bacterium]